MLASSPHSEPLKPKYLLPLSDGTGLIYSTRQKGKILKRQKDTKLARTWHLRNTIKENSLTIRGWEDRKCSSLVAVFADFDCLPTGYSNWSKFRRRLKYLLKGKALVFPSHSGKAKAILTVNLPHGAKMDETLAINILQRHLPANIFKFLDISYGGMSLCFLTNQSLNYLNNNLSQIKPIKLSISDEIFYDQRYSYLDSMYQDIEKDYLLANEIREDLYTCGHSSKIKYRTLPKITDKELITSDSLMNQLIKFLLATPALMYDGFDISQEILGNTLGISRKRAGRLLKKALNEFLEVVDASSAPGVKAITYKAKGRLLEALKKIYQKKRTVIQLPKVISPGAWNHAIKYYGLRFFSKNPLELIKWIRTISGSSEKDRLKQAQRFAEWMLKTFSNQLMH